MDSKYLYGKTPKREWFLATKFWEMSKGAQILYGWFVACSSDSGRVLPIPTITQISKETHLERHRIKAWLRELMGNHKFIELGEAGEYVVTWKKECEIAQRENALEKQNRANSENTSRSPVRKVTFEGTDENNANN